MKKKNEHYYGSDEYHCPVCGHAHHERSEIGKAHLRYARSEVQGQVRRKYEGLIP